ncbi:site-specific integrase [bacterium AH-315-E09]|nr:site-specific integrase [bacterium AH-315-E09]
MKVNLEKYKHELSKMVEKGRITSDTMRTFASCMRMVAAGCSDKKELKNFLMKLKRESDFRKYIAAIRTYEKKVIGVDRALIAEEIHNEIFNEIKKIKPKIMTINISRDTLFRKINGLKNNKLKLAYRLQLASGLRVNEIACLEKKDIIFQDGKIQVEVLSGKGNKQRTVSGIEDKYLYSRLSAYVKDLAEDEKLFYSRSYLMEKANKIGFRTHDLRRIYAKKRFDSGRKKGYSEKKAKKVVKNQLGHTFFHTTDIYLNSVFENSDKGGVEDED